MSEKRLTLRQIAFIFDGEEASAITDQCSFCESLSGGQWCKSYPNIIPDELYFGKKKCNDFVGPRVEKGVKKMIKMKERLHPGFEKKLDEIE